MIPFLILLLVFCISGCGQESRSREAEETVQAAERKYDSGAIETEAQMSTAENMEQEWVREQAEGKTQEQTEYISTVPEECFAASDHAGQVVEITYDSYDYTDASQPAIQKTAYVYLPYGYDEADQDTRYDILYLMHGWTMTAGDFFNESKSGIVSILDHMIRKWRHTAANCGLRHV